jgi:hypothetical protein
MGGCKRPKPSRLKARAMRSRTPGERRNCRRDIHLVGCGVDIEKRQAGVSGASKSSPHSLMQELLNRDETRHWGLISNGLRLRVLRDNASLTRQAFVEFDLEAMFGGEIYADFAVLWLVCHQSRLEGDKPEVQWLERWSQVAQEQGTRALEGLRSGVEEAIVALGQGFLVHPANQVLRQQLKSGKLDRQQYFRQLLRLVYRLIFLFVAEDRDLLLLPEALPEERERYLKFYSTARVRRLAERQRGGRHPDLWQGLKLLTDLLAGNLSGGKDIGLPVLGGFLFSHKAMPDLEAAQVENQALLNAVRSLAFTQEKSSRRAVDYKNLGSEELGSVYESLLELQPILNVEAGTFRLTTAAGNERKTSGSYYTNAGLIKITLDSALDPVIDQAIERAGSSIETQIAALLALKVCDPASGSGHFLIAAARRIARRLAQLRSGDEEPSPSTIRHALREVIAHCIYGVDINPMAVELCKVNLWLEALEPSKPLTFLDAHIKCGNSLVGVGPGVDVYDLVIPDEAFSPVTGDDKKVAGALKKRNKQEREGQLTFDWHGVREEPLEDYAARLRQVEAMPEDDAGQVAAKAAAYETLQVDYHVQHRRLLADLWTAAFFWRLQPAPSGALTVPTQGEWRNARLGKPSLGLATEAQRISGELNFFHWPMEFPDIFEQGGFDCVLGNPPWERLKLQEDEFFAQRDPEIANADNKAARQRLIEALNQTNPGLARDFQEAKHAADAQGKFARSSGRYLLTGTGDVNTYSIFTEHFRSLLSPLGQAGIIVPIGIATDDTTKEFFSDLMEKQVLSQIIGFENESFIFTNVHHAFKFCALSFTGTGLTTEVADFVFLCRYFEHVKQKERYFKLSREQVRRINPNTRTCPIFRTNTDAELVKRIYDMLPVVTNDENGENPWGINYIRLVHLGDHAEYVRDYDQLIAQNAQLVENQFILPDSTVYLPVYEARQIFIYNHRYATYSGVKREEVFEGKAVDLTTEEISDPMVLIIPRYWVPKVFFLSLMAKYLHSRPWLLAYRDITSNVVERTCIPSIIPFTPATVSLPTIGVQKWQKAHCLLGNLSSLIFDFVARTKVGGTHLSYGIFKQLPVLPPETYTHKNIAFIAPRVLELVYTAYDLKSFAEDMGYQGEPFRWDEDRRALLRAELDAYYARLYGMNRKQLRYILDPADLTRRELEDILDPWEEVADPLDPQGYDQRRATSDFPGETFRVLKEKEIKQYGEYRTRRLVLEAWERLEGVERVTEVEQPLQPAIDLPAEIHVRQPLPEINWIPVTLASADVEQNQWKSNYRQAVAVAWLLKNFGDDESITLFKAQKYSYFLQRKSLANLEIPYREFAAGPYSRELTYRAGEAAKRRNYWTVKGKTNVVRGRNINKAIEDVEKVLTNVEQAKLFVNQLTELESDDLGGVATVDFAGRAIFERDQAITPDNIRAYFQSDWPEKVEDPWYTDENIYWAMEELSNLGLFEKSELTAIQSSKISEPAPEVVPQPMLSDFGLYKCEACGKMVMGFEKEQHAKEVHKGKEAGYKKLR